MTYIRTTPGELWAALTTLEFMKKYWFRMNFETDWKAGSPWELIFPDGRIARKSRTPAFRAGVADAPTRAANEAVQIGRPRAALPFSPRSDQQPIPSPPRSRHCCRAQSFQNPHISGLGRDLQHGLSMKFLLNFASRLPPVTPTRQVDGALWRVRTIFGAAPGRRSGNRR